jgi:hypothetical protein
MSSQRFRLHRSVPVAAALTLAFVLASPQASIAAPHSTSPAKLVLHTADPSNAVTQYCMKIGMKIASNLRSIFQAADSGTGDPAPDAVDPWDDDLGKKPPQ